MPPLIYFHLKSFYKTSFFWHLLFLRYLQSLNPTSQISKFYTKLAKIESLITLDRDMISTWNFHQLLIITKKTADVWRHNSKWRAKKIFSVLKIWRAIGPQPLFFMKDGGQPHERAFFLLSESGNRIEKSSFNQELWLFENSIQIFNFWMKNADVRKILRTWYLMVSWCTTEPNFLFLAYPYLEIWTTSKNYPQAYHGP